MKFLLQIRLDNSEASTLKLFSSGFGKLATTSCPTTSNTTDADDIILGEGTFQVRDIAASSCAIRYPLHY
jgi:hypothetical protein